MPPIGPENFHRLEEFPSFVSCIRSFGKSIIPPLLIPSRRHKLKELAIAAVKKEEEILRKKEIIREKKDVHVSPEVHRDSSRSHSQSDMQESCALWYPSAKDCPEGISVAISKFPTSGIYSSVHTDSIVCSNVIESEATYTDAIMRNSLLVPESDAVNCFECSHDGMNLDCSLCQAEYNQDFSKGFVSEISPEVPCRTYSLLQHSGVEKDESSYTAETDCESLPTVIFNKKCIPNDTDTESTATYMTQSTDLEKYMELSCEFSSPDNWTIPMDSKSACQLYMYSRSDDVSSETIVNTENELTPCASTMAELTDNIEDELSNAEDIAATSDTKEVTPGRLKRAHSVDSYMKILQTCEESTSVRKSLSDSFDADLRITLDSNVETRPPINFKTSFLIKEDSKESEESKEVPENDVFEEENVEENSLDEHESVKTEGESLKKRHVRQNSYTLDHPSSALILAHADCMCNFDTNCIPPHCSALTEVNEEKFKSAFMKEKVEVNIPKSQDQMKNLSLLNPVCLPEDITVNLEEMTTTVDVFPIVNEGNSEKSDSGNAEHLEIKHVVENVSAAKKSYDDSRQEEEHLKEMFSKYFDAPHKDKKQEYFQEIYKKLQESHEKRVKKLYEQQNQEWSNLKEELNQEMILCQNLKPTFLPTCEIGPPVKIEEKDQIESAGCCSDEMTGKETLFDKRLAVSNSSISSSNQISTVGNALNQNLEFPIPRESPQYQHSPSKSPILPENSRASISPSKNVETFSLSPSAAVGNINNTHFFKESDSSLNCSFSTNDVGSNSPEAIPNMNCPPRATLPPCCNSAPHPPNVISVPSGAKCDNTCFCDSSAEQDKSCTSVNGDCDCDINFSHSEYMPDIKRNLVSSYNNLGNAVHLSHQLTSCVSSENLEPETLCSCQDTDCGREKVSSSSTLNNSKLPNVMNKEKRNIAPKTSKDESKFPVKNLFSTCANTLKNGTVSSEDASMNARAIGDPALLKKFEKLPAFVKGYLTRRLFKTERVVSLIKTLNDTVLLFKDLRDENFQRQLLSQCVRTYGNLYDIFCTISTKERMNIIAESRNYRRKKSEKNQKPELDTSVIAKTSDPAPVKSHQLTSASIKALERKKKSSINSRTYTKEDLKNARSRSVLEMRTYTIDDIPNFAGSLSSKSVSVSPYSGCKGNTGMKRKTSSAKSRQCLHHHKWVP